MSTSKRAVHVATIKKSHKGKTYITHLLKDLATPCKNRTRWNSSPEVEFDRLTWPADLHRRVFELLGLGFEP